MSTAVKKLLILAGALAVAGGCYWLWRVSNQPDNALPNQALEKSQAVGAASPGREGRNFTAEFLQIEAREKEAAERFWDIDLLAQECGRTIENFWDAINRSTHQWTAVTSLPFEKLLKAGYPTNSAPAHRIEQWPPHSPPSELRFEEWLRMVAEVEQRGWKLANLEFRHSRFKLDSEKQPRSSTFYFAANLTNEISPGRASLSGDLVVVWGKKDAQGQYAIQTIDATGLQVLVRKGEAPFRLVLDETLEPNQGSLSIDPLLVGDLDGDGSCEIIVAGKNLIYRRGPDGRFSSTALSKHDPGPISTALIADFDNDGTVDLLAQKFDGLFLHRGSARPAGGAHSGVFEKAPERVSLATKGMLYPMAMTCGDIDLDGDLDVFIGQYKNPYQDGSMPTPFYNANDGWPAMLLLNDGRARFRDGTPGSGLEGKLRRRAYSSSIVPLDEDALPDLAVISDFAGIDVYRNTGKGLFRDVTAEWLPEHHAFGMAHCFADFNRDGVADLFLTGMTSPTVERLNHLQLSRNESALELQMRTAMTVGSRLYLGSNTGRLTQTALGASAARTGWAWGCAAPDVDNDGFADLFVVNGLESNASVRDYEPEYWLHDRYSGNSEDDPAAQLYFHSKLTRTRSRDYSYGGYEKNRLYLNRKRERFLEVGHLLGIADELDSRNALAADLNGDGRMDLVYLTWEIWPAARQRVRVLENQMEAPGRWIAVALPDNAMGIGARVLVTSSNGTKVALTKVAGESYGSQYFGPLHAGLGPETTIQSVEVRWPGGKSTVERNPRLIQVLKINAPDSQESSPPLLDR